MNTKQDNTDGARGEARASASGGGEPREQKHARITTRKETKLNYHRVKQGCELRNPNNLLSVARRRRRRRRHSVGTAQVTRTVTPGGREARVTKRLCRPRKGTMKNKDCQEITCYTACQGWTSTCRRRTTCPALPTCTTLHAAASSWAAGYPRPALSRQPRDPWERREGGGGA